MANKKINELTELTTIATDDLVMLYDTSEAGSEKTKKMSAESLATLTDGWVLIDSGTFSNEAVSGVSITPQDNIKYKFVIDGVSDGNSWLQLSFGGITSGWRNIDGFTNTAYIGAPVANNRIYGEYIVPPVNNGSQKLVTGHLYKVGSATEEIYNYNTSTATVTYINVVLYKSANQNFTGKVKVFAQAW